MRKKKYFKIKLWLFMLVALISSCESEQESTCKAEITDPAIMEAKSYFENSIVAILPEDESKNLLYPGMFAPTWYKAERVEKSGIQYMEIPFESTFRFRIGQTVRKDKQMKKQNVNAWQKMVMIKNIETNEYSSYFATLVPTREYFVKHKNMDSGALNIYSDNNDFSGKVIFTTMDNAKIIRIISLKDGKTTRSATLLCPKEEREVNIKKINKLLSGISITKKTKINTRSELDGGWLDEVIVTPDDGGGDDDNDYWWNPYPDDDNWYNENDDWYDENDGGGASGGSNSHDNSQDPHADFDVIVNKVISELSKLGIQISKTVFKKSESGCAANARIIIDPKTKIKRIEICPEFYKQPLKNRIAITYHENYHLKNDKDSDNKYKLLNSAIIIKPPTNIENSYKSSLKTLYGGNYIPPAIFEEDYKQEMRITHILPPQYYQNEINAYRDEIQKIKDVTKDYDDLRNYMLWRNEQLLEISKKHYK